MTKEEWLKIIDEQTYTSAYVIESSNLSSSNKSLVSMILKDIVDSNFLSSILITDRVDCLEVLTQAVKAFTDSNRIIYEASKKVKESEVKRQEI